MVSYNDVNFTALSVVVVIVVPALTGARSALRLRRQAFVAGVARVVHFDLPHCAAAHNETVIKTCLY